MDKYRSKPYEVYASQDIENLLEGYVIYFSGSFYNYEEYFDSYDNAIDFINRDLGRDIVDYTEKKRDIEYNSPKPYILNGTEDVEVINEYDYIVIDEDGNKYVWNPTEFLDSFELIEE